MDHHQFRILGLDTSFSDLDEPNRVETRKKPPTGAKGGVSPSPGSRASTSGGNGEDKVSVRLAEILPLLIDATQKNRAWIKDFGDDNVAISQDLYEVVLAYRSMGRAA